MDNLYEVLGLSSEYQESLLCAVHDAKYSDFIRNRLFYILKYSIRKNAGNSYGDDAFYVYFNYNSIKERNLLTTFCNMYGFDLKQLDQTRFYISGITGISGIKKLLDAFYGELQRIEYYSKEPEKMQAERDAFLESQREGR